MAGMEGEVRIEATNAKTGASYGSYLTDSGKKHTAFQLSRAIPRIQEEGIGGAHIYGKVALMGLDFCDGQLIQFRLPHAGPSAGSASTQPEVESLDIRVEKGAGFLARWTYKIKVTLRNPTAQDQTYWAKMVFKDSDGFLVQEAPLRPGRTGDQFDFSFCDRGDCDMFVPAGETREFLGNILVDSDDAERIDLDESELSITATD